MKVAITGVGGFIGSAVANLMLRRGYEVVGMDNLDPYYPPDYKLMRLKKLEEDPKFTFIRGDFTLQEDVDRLLRGVEGVIHVGAKAGVRASIRDPQAYIWVNTVGTLRLLEGMLRIGIKRIVMASTSSIYAGHPAPFVEDMKVDSPISPYAVSKKAAENLLYTYHHLYGIEAFILRYFTVYGPFGRPDMSVFKLLYAAMSGEEFPLYGDGTQRRSFTYVDDVVKATVLAYEKVRGYEIVNVGNPNDHPLSYITELIEKFTGRSIRIRRFEFNKADLPITKANVDKARRILGWEPELSLEEGMRRTSKWFVENWQEIRNVFPHMPDI
ncbi:MAG: NAD-dependent epimerase/dehydratase family protein [Thermotogae bacterium]|nr:NAD-dependent epimerase/dehydratase family protein [Thermotogota bacterium]